MSAGAIDELLPGGGAKTPPAPPQTHGQTGRSSLPRKHFRDPGQRDIPGDRLKNSGFFNGLVSDQDRAPIRPLFYCNLALATFRFTPNLPGAMSLRTSGPLRQYFLAIFLE